MELNMALKSTLMMERTLFYAALTIVTGGTHQCALPLCSVLCALPLPLLYAPRARSLLAALLLLPPTCADILGCKTTLMN